MTESQLDTIRIHRLTFRCIIGTNPEEREKEQEVIVDIAVKADLSRACRSDSLEDTINYKQIKQSVIRMGESSRFFLIERLAQEIADICLGFDGVREVAIRLEKPGALRFTRSVSIEITRNNS